MTVRIAQWVLRTCAGLALILGILFWTGNAADSLTLVHMGLGVLVVLALWTLGLAQALTKGGSRGLAIGAVVVGLILAASGGTQDEILTGRWLLRHPGDPPAAGALSAWPGKEDWPSLQAPQGVSTVFTIDVGRARNVPVFQVETSLRGSRVLEQSEIHGKGTSTMSTRTNTRASLHLQGDTRLQLKLIGYWVTTAAIALEALAGGVSDLIHGPALLFAGDPIVPVLARLGYPVYLLTILGCWKLLGAMALLAPRFPRLKEWAYAGTFFVYVGAAASWAARGGGLGDLIAPLIFAMLTLASWALRPPSRTLGVRRSARARA